MQVRQEQAIPVWKSFSDWATEYYNDVVRHTSTNDAIQDLLKHSKNMQTYCYDERLPILNIKSEHVAKTIAIARKNFMFADTEAGAESTARVFSVIETARANGHNPHKYLSALLTELPNVKTTDDIDALLPWAITPVEITQR